jgi:hypothetical protein
MPVRYRLNIGGEPPPVQMSGPDWLVGVTVWPDLDTYGICVHPNFDNAAYGDTDAWTQKVADLGVYAFRGLAQSNLDHVQRTAVRARELGLKWLASVATIKTTDKQLRANLEFVAANADVFIAVEGINEPDHDGLTLAEVAKTVRYQKIIWEFVTSRPELAHLVVLAPALRRPAPPEMYQRFADAGIVGLYHAVSLHHYQRDGLTEHLDMVCGMWACDRVWVTETGYTTATESTDPRRATEDQAALAAIPHLLQFLAEPRVEKVFRYELLDDDAPLTNNEAHFGVYRADGSPKPEVAEILRFTQSEAGP